MQYNTCFPDVNLKWQIFRRNRSKDASHCNFATYSTGAEVQALGRQPFGTAYGTTDLTQSSENLPACLNGPPDA